MKPSVALLLVVLNQIAGAQPGTLDTTFGANGITITSVLSTSVTSRKLIVKDDDKILVAGGGNNDCILVQYMPEGLIDSSFGNNGYVIVDLDRTDAVFISAALQSDGKIVLCAKSGLVNSDYLLAKVLPTGVVDSSFGINGRVSYDFNNLNMDEASCIAILPDDKILVAGITYVYNTDYEDVLVMRLHPDGMPDSSFAQDGRLLIPWDIERSDCNDIAILPDGKVLLAGHSDYSSGANYFATLRLLPEGIIDSSFGENGFSVKPAYDGVAYSLALQQDGKIVLAGQRHNDINFDFMLVRYHENGTIDSTFGTNGMAITNDSTSADHLRSVAIQADGKIVICGKRTIDVTNITDDFVLMRFNSDGSVDNSFGNAGLVITTMEDEEEFRDIEFQSDGKIIAAGYSESNRRSIVIARYLSSFGVGVEEIVSPSQDFPISVFPNPTQSEINVSVTLIEESTVELSLHNLNGVRVVSAKTEKLSSGKHTLSLNAIGVLSPGYYILHIKSKLELDIVPIIKLD